MKKKQGFVQGALIIAIAGILVKIIGAVYKIPLRKFILGADGIGIYTAAYTIYNVLFIVATAGIPVAISKMVAESVATKNYKETKKIYNVAKILLTVIGLVGSSVMFFGARPFAEYIRAEPSVYAIMALSPSLFFVCVMSIYRGFNQGLGNMLPTAVSEIIEALGKLVIGLVLAAVMIPMGKQFSAAGAILGVSTGTFIGAVYMFIYNTKNKRELKTLVKDSTQEKVRSSKEIFLRLMTLAVPITLGSTVFTMATLIDLGMIMRQLEAIGFDETTRIQLYGYYAGDAVTMFNMPNVVITGMSVSVVPAIAGALALGNKKEARFTAATALRLTLIFAVPCAVGMSTLSAPILSLLMGDAGGATLLSILAYGIIFLSMVMVTNSILQSIGKVWVPIIHMLIGAVVKIAVNYALVGNPAININGAPIGTDLCYLVTATLNLLALKRYLDTSVGIANILKIGGSAAIMGLLTYIVYGALIDVTDYKLALVIAIALAVLIYFVSLIVFKGIKKEDVDLMPGATKINKIIGRFL